jgi:hypothetical protein
LKSNNFSYFRAEDFDSNAFHPVNGKSRSSENVSTYLPDFIVLLPIKPLS